MKKASLLLLSFMLMCFGLANAEVVKIGEGTGAVHTYLPTTSYYNYSLTQQIYTQSEIGSAQTLENIAFFNDGVKQTRGAIDSEGKGKVDIYLVHTDKTSFAGEYDWIPFSDADKVFSGTITFELGDWTVINFDTPFSYNGTDNLAVIVDDDSGSWEYNKMACLVFDAPGQALYISGDNTNYNADGLSGYSGETPNVKNQIRFNDVPRTRPTSVSVSDITYESAIVTWESEGSKWNLKYRKENDSEWTFVSGLTSKSYELTGLDLFTDYRVGVQIDQGDSSPDGWMVETFTTCEKHPRPSNIYATDITPTSATLNWTDNCGASKWCIYITSSSYDNYIDVSTNPYTLTGLTPQTKYTVYIFAYVGEETSLWSYSSSFTTADLKPTNVAVSTTPTTATISWQGYGSSYEVKYRERGTSNIFYEDFENGLDDKGWTVYTMGEAPESGGWYILNDTYALSGAYVACATSWMSNVAYDADNWLITPPLDLQGTLSFWARNVNRNYPDTFEVLLSTTGNAISDFTIELQPMWAPSDEWSKVTIDLDSYAGQKGYIAIHHVSNNQYALYIDDFALSPASESWNVVSTTEQEVTITGLKPNTSYDYQVISIIPDEENLSTEIATFTTLGNNPVPYDVAVSTTSTTATVSWQGFSDSYTLRYVAPATSGTNIATIILRTDDVWGDGSGYQMLIDGDADTFGRIFTSSSHITDNGDADPSVYAEFEFKIPENADGSTTTSNVVFNSQKSIQIPAGTYDFCITNPTPGDRIWIAAGQRYDDYVFEAGVTYEFYVHAGTDGDATDLTTYGGSYDWDHPIVIDNVTSPFTIDGLTPNTPYQYQIVGKKAGEEDAATDIASFATGISLAFNVNDDNINAISMNDGVQADVTIEGRTIKNDGRWESICLPFDVELAGSPLEGADVRMAEDVTRVDNFLIVHCLTPVDKITVGTPYIIRWDGPEDIVNPEFKGVTIQYELRTTYMYGSQVSFGGMYRPDSDTRRNYYIVNGGLNLGYQALEADSKMYAFECFFWVKESLNETIEGIGLNVGNIDETIDGIMSIKDLNDSDEPIYNLAGQRMSKKQKGINITKGHKVLVK